MMNFEKVERVAYLGPSASFSEMAKDIFEKTKVPREHKHEKDLLYGVSPHILKCTRYQGKEYMMGQCEMTLHPKEL